MQKEQSINFTGIGDNDQVPYSKIDVIKSCRVGTNFAISFYQIDYHALANSLNKISNIEPSKTKLMPLSKVVMDRQTFDRLRKELDELAKGVDKSMGNPPTMMG